MTRVLVRSLLSGVSFAALTCSAFAADMPLKAPPPAIPTYSWTGFYGGLHAGGGWHADDDATVTMQRFSGQYPPGNPKPLQTFDASTGSFPVGGLQVGYNWQIQQHWVIGLEVDFSGSWNDELGAVLSEGPITDTVTSKRGIDWFGTVRGRVGYLFTPTLLGYGTGGLLYGHTRNDFTQAITGPGPVGSFTIVNGASDVSAGWTVGGGLEWAMAPKWSVKLEYDYLHFDDAVSSSTTIAFTSGKGGNTGVFNVDAPNTSAHIIQVGLNYHFWN